MSKINSEEALKNYYENPKLCKNCGKVIEIKYGRVSEAKRTTFCSIKCSARYKKETLLKKIL